MTTFTDVASPGCGCDDLVVTFDSGRLVKTDGGCPQCRASFAALNDSPPPVADVRGKPAGVEDAIAAATEILRQSQAPLFYGLAHSSTPGQRAAYRLAERLGAVVDPAASRSHGPGLLAIQEVGESTCTLGDVRDRADLVIFWGVDPVTTHPGHLERFSADPASDLLPRGRQDRTLIVVDAQPTTTAARADHFLPVASDGELEAVCQLRALLRNDSEAVSSENWQTLAAAMTACRYGVLFYDPGENGDPLRHLVIQNLLRLVTELNGRTRFCAVPMSHHGSTGGADTVLCWQTGFPFAVDFSRGFPRYNPGEFTADERLARREVDACVILGSDAVSQLSPAARQTLDSLPTIVLDPCTLRSAFAGSVRFATALYGVHAAGTLYRSDGLALPLRALQSTEYPTDEWVLDQLLESIPGGGRSLL